MTTTDEHADVPGMSPPEISLDRLRAAVDVLTMSASAHEQLGSALLAAQKLAADEVRERLTIESANRELQQQLEKLRTDARRAKAALTTMKASKTFRYTRALRHSYGRLRSLRKRAR